MNFSRYIPRIALGDIVWLAVVIFVLYRIGPQVRAAMGAGSPGELAASSDLRTLDGSPISLSELRGSVVLVNFWATWCPPCRLEMPGFERVYRSRADQGFVILGVSTDRGGVEDVRRFLEDRGISYPVAMATPEVVRDFGGVRSLPTSFLIDREGRIRHRVIGIFTEPALRLAVDQLLKEERTPPRGGAVAR